MQPKDFGANSPGRLEGTEIAVTRVRMGVPQTEMVRGIAFVPNPLPPSLDWRGLIGRVWDVLIHAERQLARLDAMSMLLPNPGLLLRPLMMREAVQSSEIENTIATLEEVALQRAGVQLDREDPLEVANYVEALDHGLRSDYPFGPQLLHEMHTQLLKGVRGEGKLPGRFRAEQNLIGREGDTLDSCRYVPPPAGATLESAMRGLFAFLNDAPDEIPRLISVALAHYQFEAIHPYRDGNGRIGRLLNTLALCRYKLVAQPAVYVSGYFERRRQAYYDHLLAVSTRGDWEAWIRFFLEAIAVQSADAGQRVEALAALRDEYHRRVASPRMASLTRTLIDRLFDSPVLTVQDVCRLLRVTDTAARRHVEALLSTGVLEELEGSKRPRGYICREILRVAEGRSAAPFTGPKRRR